MRMLILYGSQSGTAQDVAEAIWRVSKNFNFSGPVLSLDSYDIEKLITEELAIFVCATTGQGDEPDNMKFFWKFLLKKSLPPNSLENLKFAVLGLGDSSYVKYNVVAKKLFKRLIQLSASPLVPLGLCDDQHDHGVYGAYFPWVDNLWKTLDQKLINKTKYYFKMRVNTTENRITDCANIDTIKWPLKENPISLTIMENHRVTSEDHFQDVRHIKLKFPKEVFWKPFDVVNLRPWNDEENVKKIFKIFSEQNLKFEPEMTVTFESMEPEMRLPPCFHQPLPLRLVAKYIWDLTAVPRQKVFELLSLHCIDETEKEKLLELYSSQGLDDFIKYSTRPKRTILEVLHDFPNAVSKLTLPVLFEMFDIIKTRAFSIASTPEVGSLDILVAIVEYKTIMAEPRKGLCSNWLKSLQLNEEVFGCIKKGTMQLPEDKNLPLIMIGPGTGIAPFRSYLLKNEYEIQCNPSTKRQEVIVFFGCRSQFKDLFFKNDFKRLQNKKIAKFFYAFSRDQEYKIYVQHAIKKQENLIRNVILLRNGFIFVAGNSNNMPKQVRETFTEIFGNPNYLDEILINGNRYQEEVWS